MYSLTYLNIRVGHSNATQNNTSRYEHKKTEGSGRGKCRHNNGGIKDKRINEIKNNNAGYDQIAKEMVKKIGTRGEETIINNPKNFPVHCIL